MQKNDYRKKLISLALPIALQNLMLALVAACDAMMLGNLEQDSMAAVSLATQIQFVQNMIIMSIVSALAILGAQYWGKGDMKSMSSVFGNALRLSVAVSVVFFVGCIFFPRELMHIFTNEEVLVEIGIRYLKIAGWSYLITGISQCYLMLMKISEHPATTASITVTTVVINIILNAIFIFGLCGAQKLGVKGAAYATLVARIIELTLSVAFSFQKGYMRPRVIDFFKGNRLLTKDFLKCTWPLVGACLFWSIGFTSYTAFMGHLGKDAAAANSVAAVLRDLVCCMCNGIASGGGILVGNELGAGNLEQGKAYGIRLAKLSFVIGFISTGIMLAVAPFSLHFVKLTPEAKKILLGMMIIMAVYMIGRSVNTVIINGIFAAGGDTMYDMYSLAVCMWGIAVPLAALGTFLFHWPVLVVYACTCLDEVGKIPWVLVHFKKYKWVKNLTREDV